MRDLKFRVWNVDKKRWETDYERCYLNEEGCCEIEFTNMYTSGLKRINAVVNLYTGLKDKNGKEIYEGDVCELRLGDLFVGSFKAKVIYEQGSFGVIPLGNETDIFGNKYSGKMLSFYPSYNPELLEIIGNIYENPYLLNKEQNDKRSVARDDDSSTKAD